MSEIKYRLGIEGVGTVTGGLNQVDGALGRTEASSERAATALNRMGSVKPMTAARDILNIRSSNEITREIQLVQAAYARLANSGKVTQSELERAHAAMTASVARLKAEMESTATTAKMTAAQTAAAMRSVPAQMTDIVVGLSTGQSPFMVLMQQGGQLKDMFGGIGPATRALGGYVMGLVNPFTIAAAAAATLGAAWYQAQGEAEALTQSLVKTGHQTGLTANELQGMASRLGTGTESVHGATDALVSMVQAGVGNAASLESMTAAALKWSRATGDGVDEVAKNFAALAKDPLGASLRLNESTGMLTSTILQQIQTLVDQGRQVDAARVAQEAYSASLTRGADEISGSLSSLAKSWSWVKEEAGQAWSMMMAVFRGPSLDDKISEAQRRVQSLSQASGAGGFGAAYADAARQTALKREQDNLAALQAQKAATEDKAKAAAEEQKHVKGTAEWLKIQGQYADNEARKAEALAKARAAFDASGSKDTGAWAKVEAQINKQFEEKPRARSGVGAFNRQEGADVALAKAKAAALRDEALRGLEAEKADMDRYHAMGALSAEGYYAELQRIEREASTARLGAIDADIAAERARRTKTAADATAQQARLVELASQRSKEMASADLAIIRLQDQADASTLAASQQRMQQWSAGMEATRLQAETWAEQSAVAMAALITDPMARARAEADITAKAIERSTSDTIRALQNQAAILRGNGEEAQAKLLEQQISAAQSGSAAAAARARQQPDLEAFKSFTNVQPGAQLADGFDKASQSMSAFVRGFQGLISMDEQYQAAKRAAAGNAAAMASVERANMARQVGAYATLAGAAKGMFKEHTAGYKALEATEKAFRAYELASAIAVQGSKLGLWGAETAAKVAATGVQAGAVAAGQGVETAAVTAGEAARNVAKVPGVFMSFMSAMGPWGMAAAGVAIAAVMGGAFRGGSGGSFAATNTGTGTVLGDSSAASKSLQNSIELLKDVDTLTMRYSAQMLTSLQSIDSKIGGVSNILLRNGDVITGGGLGIATWMQKNVGDPLLNMIGIDSTKGLGDALINAVGLGGVLDTVQGWWGSVSQEINAAGIQINGRLQDVVNGAGMARFADVTNTEKSWFGLSKDVSTSTQTAALDPTIASQFSLILSGYSGTLQAAASAIGGTAAEVAARLNTFTVDIGRVDLKGLTGDALVERLEAVFSAEGDKMAAAAIPGLERFTKVGEGYLETVVRVANGAETAHAALRRLGLQMVDLSTVANTQGDVDAELVRQSIVASEAGRSLSRVFADLSGTSSDLASTYKGLVDVRRSLVALGLDGEATTRALVTGAGDLQSLTDGLSAYADKFMTTAQRQALGTARITDAFSALGVSVPQTAAEFRALVNGTNTTTEAGQQLLGGLMSLTESYADWLDVMGRAEAAVKSASEIASERVDLEGQLLQLQGDTAAIRARELAKLDASNQTLQQRIWALQDEQDALDKLSSAGQGIITFVNELRGVSGTNASVAALRATYQSTLAAAQAGDTTASSAIAAQAKALVDSIKASATDPIALARETSRIASELANLPASVAYATQQATTAVVTAAVANVPTTATGTGTDATTSLAAEMSAMRQELAAMRSELNAGMTATASATATTARILQAVTPDGDSVAITTAV